MMRYALALILALPARAQEAKQEMRVVLDDDGVIVTKPKDEAWKVAKGSDGAKLFKETAAIVKQRVDDLQIEVLVEKKQDNQNFNEFKKVIDDLAANFEKDKDQKPIPDRKVKKRKSDKGKFPGAGGLDGWYAELEILDKDEVKLVVRHWLFVDKQNRNHMVRISVVGMDDVCKKYEKDVNFILGAIQTFKVKKK